MSISTWVGSLAMMLTAPPAQSRQLDPPSVREQVEVIDEIVLNTMISIGDLTPHERYAAEVCATNAAAWTKSYARSDILSALMPGTQVRVRQNCDVLQIGFSVPIASLTQGLSVMHAILSEPVFQPDTFLISFAPARSAWNLGYETSQQTSCELNPAIARQFWRWLVFTHRIDFAVKGPFMGGEAQSRWARLTKSWPAQSVADNVSPNRINQFKALRPSLKEPTATIVQLNSKPILASDPNLANYLMAANILGVGKDCLLWKVLREELQISYRQEAFLIPSPKGWQFRIQYASLPAQSKPAAIQIVKKRLLESIEKLDGRDLARSIGVARGYFVFDQPTLPLYIMSPGSLSESNVDQFFWENYFRQKTGTRWNMTALMSSAALARLNDIKELCQKLVLESETVTY